MAEERKIQKKKKSTAKEQCKCKICGDSKAKANFYLGLPYCKKCMKSVITDNNGDVTEEGFSKALQMLNKPFVRDLFVKIATQDKTTVDNFLGEYLRQINVSREYKDGKYADSILYNMKNEEIAKVKSQVIKEVETVKESEQIISDEIRFFWCKGVANLPDKEILILQKMYDEYTNNGDSTIVTSKKVQDDFQTLCTLELQKSKVQYNLEEVKTYQTLQKMVSELSESLGIQAIQKSARFDSNKFTLGLLCRYRELSKPIPRWEEDLGNYNSMRDLIKVHYLGGAGLAMSLSSPEIDKARERLKQFEVDKGFDSDEDEEDDVIEDVIEDIEEEN